MSTVADLPAGWTRVRDTTRWRWVRGGGVEAEATWWGPGSTYAAFLKAVGGLEEEIDYGGGITVTRVVPLKFPSDSPDFDNVYASDCDLVGMGRPSEHPTEGIAYEWATARVYFRSEPFYNFGDGRPLVSYGFTAGLDMVTRPGTAYRFPSDGKRLNQDVGVPVPWRDFQMTLHNLLASADALYDSLLGRVNSVDFEAPNGQVYPPGTVLYLGPAGGFTRTIGNVTTWTITHRLKFREVPHNEIMRPDGAGFEAPEDDDDNPMLESGDLMALYENADPTP